MKSKGDMLVVGTAPNEAGALELIAESRCEVLVQDSITTALQDLEFLHKVMETVPGVKVVLVGMDANEKTFLRAVRAGVVGYVRKDGSAMDVVNAVRLAAQGEAACPPSLCLSLFRYVAQQRQTLPNFRLTLQLGLTRRQQQLVPLIARGLTNKEIANQLNLSEQTVKNHVHRMLQRVGASDRLAIVEMVRVQEVFL